MSNRFRNQLILFLLGVLFLIPALQSVANGGPDVTRDMSMGLEIPSEVKKALNFTGTLSCKEGTLADGTCEIRFTAENGRIFYLSAQKQARAFLAKGTANVAVTGTVVDANRIQVASIRSN